MITIAQCRAARGLLDWTQQDLAEKARLSKTAINNYEKGYSDIKSESLRAIQLAFEDVGVQFLDTYGITRKSENTRVLKGPSAFQELLNDIKKAPGHEILIANIDSSFSADVNELLKYCDIANIPIRQLSTEGLVTENNKSRILTHNSGRSGISTFIYGFKTAFVILDSALIILIESLEITTLERHRFEYLWQSALSDEPAKRK